MDKLKFYSMYSKPYEKLYGRNIFNSTWVSDRYVKWTWPRMIHKTKEVWRAGD